MKPDSKGSNTIPAIDAVMKKGNAPLNPNHSHFILVDNVSEDNSKRYEYGSEIQFRAAFEKALIKKYKKTQIVLIVVGGGPGTLETIQETLVTGAPVILVAVINTDFFSEIFLSSL